MRYKRVILIVLDSVGVGSSKDAYKYGDYGANTLLSAIKSSGVELKNLDKLGLLNLIGLKRTKTNGVYAKMSSESVGKDTLTGHLELMGISTKVPFQTFPKGFPIEFIKEFEEKIGRKVLGNISASGTEIIEELGSISELSKGVIVYTSADSVLQIAASEDVVPLDELYRICEIARSMTNNETIKLGRIIARPFKNVNGSYVRTENRKDYALDPISKTALDYLSEDGLDVISVGKISDIFNNNGITKKTKTKNNLHGIMTLLNEMKEDFHGLLFVNLNDFDSLYGHRRNALGYGLELKVFDDYLPEIIDNLRKDDLLMITADHGNDPAFHGTDHTREDVPLLIYNKKLNDPMRLNDLNSFTVVADTILDNFKLKQYNDSSILKDIK